MNTKEKELIKKIDRIIKLHGGEYPVLTELEILKQDVKLAIRTAVGEREKEIVKGIMDQRISFVGKDLYLEGYHKAINNILKLMSKEILSKMGIALKGEEGKK